MCARRASPASATSPEKAKETPCRHLIIVLGDQLDAQSLALQDADPARDVVLMMEVIEESRHVPSHAVRTVLFLSAMRHFADALRRERSLRVRYVPLDDPANTHSFSGEVLRAAQDLRPARIVLVQPGEHRVRAMVDAWRRDLAIPIDVREDAHFLTTPAQFQDWAKGRKELTMEYFYREQRRRLGILMEPDAKTPLSGTWNYDKDNRQSFPKTGPSPRPPGPRRFEPDETTRAVIDAVRRNLPNLPGVEAGGLAHFGWPVTREDALAALEDFVRHRLALFGPFEDAMWDDEPFVYHSVLSPLLNLKLLRPMECVDAALHAYRKGRAPLQSVEAFVRQIIGWREFIRGVYDREGAGYADRNGLGQHGRLPDFYWTGETDMACLRACVGQVVERSFAHHIQRLMVMGNFALIAGVHPRAISDWFLGMYVDGVDWATLPNTLGMAMHADGTPSSRPVVGTKPYASSGQYIKKMSNYCSGCRFDPAQRTGERACPFTVFYWDFLHRHRERFAKNPRMAQILGNLDRFGDAQLTQISVSARSLRQRLGIGDIDTSNPTHQASGRTYTPAAPAPRRGSSGLFDR